MSEKFLIISNVVSLIKTFYDLLPKMKKGDEVKIERAEKFFYLATKVEVNLIDLILYVYGKHNEKILEFINAVKNKEKADIIKMKVNNLLTIFPLPSVSKLPEEDSYSIIINLFTELLFIESIEKVNSIAEALKKDPKNITLLSQLWASLTRLVKFLMDGYEMFLRFKMESIGKILEKEIREKIDKDIKKNVENLRMLCEAYKRESDEFDRECYEIKEKLKDILTEYKVE
jgi:hypothetical protein